MINMCMTAQHANRRQLCLAKGTNQALALCCITAVQENTMLFIQLVQGDPLQVNERPGIPFDLLQLHISLHFLFFPVESKNKPILSAVALSEQTCKSAKWQDRILLYYNRNNL